MIVSEVVKYGLALICILVMSLAFHCLMLFALLSFIN